MDIHVTCRHMEVTAAIRDHALGKVEEAMQGFPKITDVHVITDVQKKSHRAEVVVHAAGHVHIEADAESDDMYYSIDEAVERAVKQLRKRRDKQVDHHQNRERLAEMEYREEGIDALD